MSKVAVVILNWNGASMLRHFLPSVVEHTAAHDVSIIVADNGSTDDSLQFLADAFPQVMVITLPENYGFAEGYNRALAQVDADYFLLLNSDVLVSEGWLTPLLTFIENHPDVAAVQPKILKYVLSPTGGEPSSTFEYAGAAGGYIDRYGYPYCRGRLLDTIEEDKGQYDDAAEVDWASGACLLIRAADYRAMGGMDAQFFAHQEEIDLCWRLRIAGRHIFCCPESKVWHVGGATLPQGDPRKTFLNYRNNLTMLYKNMPRERLSAVLRRRRLIDNMTAVGYLLTGRHQLARAVWAGRKAFAAWKNEMQKKREKIQSSRRLSTSSDTRSLSLLKQYYLFRRHTWSALPTDA